MRCTLDAVIAHPASVAVEEGNHGAIAQHLTSGTLCIDLATGREGASGDHEVIGGTGRFEGAAVLISFHQIGDHSFPNGLTAFSETEGATITLP